MPILSQLLKAEMAEREVRSIAYQIKAAKLPAYKDLTGFDFTSAEVDEAMVRQLHQGDFIDGADNVVQIGGPGTVKANDDPYPDIRTQVPAPQFRPSVHVDRTARISCSGCQSS